MLYQVFSFSINRQPKRNNQKIKSTIKQLKKTGKKKMIKSNMLYQVSLSLPIHTPPPQFQTSLSGCQNFCKNHQSKSENFLLAAGNSWTVLKYNQRLLGLGKSWSTGGQPNIHKYKHKQKYKQYIYKYKHAEQHKMRSQLAAQFMPFFWLIAHTLTFRDKKYRVLMFCDKKYRILTFRDKKNRI